MKMSARQEVLLHLIRLDQPVSVTARQLAQFPWDSAQGLVTLDRSNIEEALTRFIRQELGALELEEWANLIEGRDDIEIADDLSRRAIFELANPAISASLNGQRARLLIEALHGPAK